MLNPGYAQISHVTSAGFIVSNSALSPVFQRFKILSHSLKNKIKNLSMSRHEHEENHRPHLRHAKMCGSMEDKVIAGRSRVGYCEPREV